MSRQKKLINKTNYPQHAIEKFARCVYPDIVAFYQSEEGQREFAEWQAEQAAKKAQRKLHTTKKEVTAAVTSVVILWAFSSVGLLAWKWEECGSRWGSRLARIARNKQIIRTRPRLGRTGSDYIGLVPVMGVEPIRCHHQRILSPSRLPIPTHRHIKFTLSSIQHPILKIKSQFPLDKAPRIGHTIRKAKGSSWPRFRGVRIASVRRTARDPQRSGKTFAGEASLCVSGRGLFLFACPH